MSLRRRRRVIALLVCLGLVAALTALPAPAASATTFGPATGVALPWVSDSDDLGRMVGGGSLYDPATGLVTSIGPAGFTANAITTGGLVAGSVSAFPGQDAAVYDLTTGTLTTLSALGINGDAADINDDGLVVGSVLLGTDPPRRGFIHDLTTSSTTVLPEGAEPVAVNQSGLVLANDAPGPFVLDTATDQRIDLAPRIPGLLNATALSDTGLVAGVFQDASGGGVFVHEVATNSTWRVYHPGFPSEYPVVEGVTDGGAVAGTMRGLDWLSGFVAVPEAGILEDVPPMPEDDTNSATAINNRGDVGGSRCRWDVFGDFVVCSGSYRSTVRFEPSPPRAFAVSSCAAPAVLSWQPPRFDGFSLLTGYEVRRNGVVIAALPPTATTYADPSATPGASYQVVARNAEGLSPPAGTLAWPNWPCVGGTVRGTVSASGVPQGGIGVRLVAASDGHLVRKTVTASDGTYRLSPLPPGRYALRFNDPTEWLLVEWFDDAALRPSATILDVDVVEPVVANADLVEAARIQGTVSDGSMGIVGINVRIYDATTGTLIAKTVTGLDGAYRVGLLHAGLVQVRFDDPTGLHQLRWLGGGTTVATAGTYTLEPGTILAGDEVLPGAGIVGGTVVDGAAVAVAGLPVRAYDATGLVLLGKATTDASGRYRIPALRPGAALLRFGDYYTFPIEWYHDQPSAGTADPIIIVAGQVTTVDEVVATY